VSWPSSSAQRASVLESRSRQDYTVYTGGWDIGRIYETRGGPEHLFWSFAVQGPMTRSNRVATFEEAKAQFQKAGKHGKLGRRWKRWMTRLEQRRRCVRVHGRHGRRRPGCSGVGLVLNGPELRYHLSEWRRSK